jgi:hypothetical protein
VGRPGMVIMLPTRGYRKPAPTDARTSRMGRVKPLGAPAAAAAGVTGAVAAGVATAAAAGGGVTAMMAAAQ